MPLSRRKPSRPTHGIAFSVGFAITSVPAIERATLETVFTTPPHPTSSSVSNHSATPTPTSTSTSTSTCTDTPPPLPPVITCQSQQQPPSQATSSCLTSSDVCKALCTLSLTNTDFGHAFFALCDLRNEGKVTIDHILLAYGVLRRLVVTDVKQIDKFRPAAEDAVCLVFLVAAGSPNTTHVSYAKWSRLACILGEALGGVDCLPAVEAEARSRHAWRSAQPHSLARRRDGALDLPRLLTALRNFDAGLIVQLRAMGVILTHAVQTFAAAKESQPSASFPDRLNVPDLDQYATLLSQFVTVKLQTIIDTISTSISLEHDDDNDDEDTSDTGATDTASNTSSMRWLTLGKRAIMGGVHEAEAELRTDQSDLMVALRQDAISQDTFSTTSQSSIVLNPHLDSSVHSVRDESAIQRQLPNGSETPERPKPIVVRRTNDRRGERSPFCIDFSSLQLGEKIGAGGYGEVYRATYLMSPVAVKVFHVNLKMAQFSEATLADEDVDDPRAIQRMSTMQVLKRYASTNSKVKYREFVHEVELMSVVRHPNLVLYMGACANPFTPLCIVSELFTGGSLHDYLHENEDFRPSPHTATSVSLSIARGMHYLHSSQPSILHHDLKSRNVLLSGRRGADGVPHVVICDFGLCQLFGEDGANGLSQMGTAAYMSPDSINGSSYCAKDDVYSYGVLMHEIYSGIIPYRGMRSMQIIFQVSNCGLRPTSPFDEEVPPKARQLMQECWHEERDKRPTFENIIARLDALVHELASPNADGKWP